MTKFARLVLMLFLVASWAAAQSAAPAAADDKGKADSSAAAEHKHGEPAAMSCACCKDMAKKDGMKADGMDCCAKMGKDKDAAGGGMSCGKKDDAAKAATPEQKMK